MLLIKAIRYAFGTSQNMSELVGSQTQNEVATSDGASRFSVSIVNSLAAESDLPCSSASKQFDHATKPGDSVNDDNIWLTMTFVRKACGQILSA